MINIDLSPIEFPIDIVPIDGIPESRHKKTIRTDMEAPDNFLGLVGSRYKPVSHKQAMTHALSAIQNKGLNFEGAKGDLNVFENGAMAQLEVEFPAHKRMLFDHGLTPKLYVRNSLNGVWRYQAFFGWLNSVCYNTLVSGEKLSYYSNRHTTRFDVSQANKGIANSVELITSPNSKTMQRYKNWWETRISDDAARSILKKTIAKSNATDDQVQDGKPDANQRQLGILMDEFRREAQQIYGRGDYGRENAQGSLWSLFQSATWWSTHLLDLNERSAKRHRVQERRERAVRKMIESPHFKALETV